MAYDLRTKNGYSMYEMSSMVQKAIRRGNVMYAAYAANELSVRFRKYLWKRLLTVSAEDCYGIMTQEIIALKNADDFVNEKNRPGDTNDLFIAKAVVLLCLARKNRDADYVACNFMWGDRPLTDEEYDKYVDYEQVARLRMTGEDPIPDWVFDVHTRIGVANGKSLLDMIRDEQAALNPWQPSLFDNGSWEGLFKHERQNAVQYNKYRSFAEGKKLVPNEAIANIVDDE